MGWADEQDAGKRVRRKESEGERGDPGWKSGDGWRGDAGRAKEETPSISGICV